MARRKTARKSNIQTANPTGPETTKLIEARKSSLDSCDEANSCTETPFSTTGFTLSQKISLDAKRVQSVNCESSFEYQSICEYTDEMMRSFNPKDAADALLVKDIVNLDYISTKFLKDTTDVRCSHLIQLEHMKLAIRAIALKRDLIETIDKRHGKGQQNIVVKHLRVEGGAKAMVGNFNAAASSDLSRNQDEQISASELAISKAPNEQVPVASPKKTRKRQ